MLRVTFLRHAEQCDKQTIDSHLLSFYPLNHQIVYDQIICSPYLRTRETGQLLNIQKKPLTVDLRIAEYQKCFHHNQQLDPSTLTYGNFPGITEKWEQFIQRISNFWEELQQKNGNIIVVTHGLIIRYLRFKLTGELMEVDFLTGFQYIRS